MIFIPTDFTLLASSK